MKRAARKILSVVAYLVFLGLFVEAALQAFHCVSAGDFLFVRVAAPVFASNPHSVIGNRYNLESEHHTNELDAFYYTNSQGFRTDTAARDYAYEKSLDTYRIMLLGPSFAYGWDVDYEYTFGAVLERLLEKRDSPEVETWRCSMRGFLPCRRGASRGRAPRVRRAGALVSLDRLPVPEFRGQSPIGIEKRKAWEQNPRIRSGPRPPASL